MDKVKMAVSTTSQPTRPEGKRCTLPLDEPYTLTTDQLRTHTVSSVLKNKAWDYPNFGFVSLKDDTLTLKITWDKKSYMLAVTIERDQLLVSCSCQGCEEQLCLHAYKAIRRLLESKGVRYFRNYRKDGEVSLALSHKHLFRATWHYNDFWIQEGKEAGRVYEPEEERTELAMKEALRLPLQEGATNRLSNQTGLVLCYLVLESPHRKMLPSLVPCLGRLNKAGTAVKGFEPFLSGTQKEYENLITEDQKVLNLLCLQLWKAAEGLPGNIVPKEGAVAVPELTEVYLLWRQAFSFLKRQTYVFSYPLYWIRDLKGKPQKSYVKKIEPCSDVPEIGFHLLEQETYCQLQETARSQGRPLQHFDAGLPFFIRQDDRLYLLGSLRDAAMAEWMHKMGGKLTVFRKDYHEFEHTILRHVKQHYPVEKVPASKRKNPASSPALSAK